MRVARIARHTKARPDEIWPLFAEIDRRREWDDMLDSVEQDGPFVAGTRGRIRLKGQPWRAFEYVSIEPMVFYWDRFFLPAGGRMDWKHRVEADPSGTTVSFEVSVSGPLSFVVGTIMRAILRKELPATVERLVTLAETEGSVT